MDNELLDEMIATKVMGFVKSLDDEYKMVDVWVDKNTNEYEVYSYHPSVNIEQSMQVVEKMIEDGYVETAFVYAEDKWIAEFYKVTRVEEDWDGDDAQDKLLPRAICLAALKAVGAIE